MYRYFLPCLLNSVASTDAQTAASRLYCTDFTIFSAYFDLYVSDTLSSNTKIILSLISRLLCDILIFLHNRCEPYMLYLPSPQEKYSLVFVFLFCREISRLIDLWCIWKATNYIVLFVTRKRSYFYSDWKRQSLYILKIARGRYFVDLRRQIKNPSIRELFLWRVTNFCQSPYFFFFIYSVKLAVHYYWECRQCTVKECRTIWNFSQWLMI